MSTTLPPILKVNGIMIHIIILIFSSLALLSAYVAEYLLHLSPCALCIYARIPYVCLLFIAIIGCGGHEPMRPYYLLTIICAIILGVYHGAIEEGILELSAFCKPILPIPANLSVAQLREIISMKQLPPCNTVSAQILFMSLTKWNILANFALVSAILLIKPNSSHRN